MSLVSGSRSQRSSFSIKSPHTLDAEIDTWVIKNADMEAIACVIGPQYG